LRIPIVRSLVLVLALVLGVCTFSPDRSADAAPAKPAKADKPAKAAKAGKAERRVLNAQIDGLRRATWRWQQLMGKERTRTTYDERRSTDEAYRHWVRKLWQRRARAAAHRAANPPRRAAWMCIHRYERHPGQGWATHTGNGYYGGLQMDISFQRAYGPELLRRKGTADKWTAIEQMWVAERAYRSGRGFYPWPNTARYCGLI
jgi:resuscitation-promoting factor RpfB